MPSDELTFPILSIHDIIDCMQDLEFPVTEQEIRKPTGQRMVQVYFALKEHLQGPSANFQSPACLELLDHPQLYQESVNLMAIHRELLKFFSDIGYERFTLQDVINPTYDLVRKALSAIINFFKFREQRLTVFEVCTNKAEKLLQDRKKLKHKIEDLAEKVNTIRLARAEQEPMVEKENKLKQTIGQQILEFKQHQAEIAQKIETLKNEKAQLDDKAQNSQILLNNLKQDCQRLRSQIVSNPEKLKQALRDMNQSLQEDKKLFQKAERKSRELQAKIELMNSVEQDIIACVKLLTEAQQAKQNKQTLKSKLNNEKDQLERKKQEQLEMEATEQQLARQLGSAKEKLVRLEKHQQQKDQTNAQQLSKLKRDFEVCSAERQKVQEQVDENNKIVSELEDKLFAVQREHDQESVEIKTEYQDLANALGKYQDHLLNTIQSF